MLIHGLLLLLLWGFFFVVQYFVSYLVLPSSLWECVFCTLIVFLMTCYCNCSVTLSLGINGRSAVCMVVVFPDHSDLLF